MWSCSWYKDIPLSRYLNETVNNDPDLEKREGELRMEFVHKNTIFLTRAVGSNRGFVICIK